MSNLTLTLTEAREKMATRQDELGKVFTEAKNADGKYDYKLISKDTLKSVLGDENLAGKTIDIATRIKERDDELNELGVYIETLEAAEKAASSHAARGKVRGHVPMPEGKGTRERPAVKSLGELLAEEKAYIDWVGKGHVGPLDLSFPDVYPSDILAKGMAFDTLGTKALMSTSAGFAPESVRLPGFVEMATRPIQLLDIIPMNQTSQASIKYMEETTRIHAAAEKAEGAGYAESTFVSTERSSDVRKITDSLPVTDEQFEDVPMMEGYVNGRLTFGVRQRFDGQVYVGDGNAPNLRGIVNVAGIQTQAKGADPVPDAYFKAMTKIRTVGRAIPTHHVIHPTNWEGVRLLRTADGVYIWGSPSEAGPERMWGLPVVQDDARAAGSGLVGSFQPAWISAFERRGVDIQVGYVNAQFGEGKKTVRADIRVAIVIFRPAAFCDVTGL